MRRILLAMSCVVVCLVATGCGDGMLKTQGRLVKSGQSFIPGEGEFIQILFVPIFPDGKPPPDYYAAVVDQATGTFRPSGKDGKGMPPGKYRLSIELMKERKDQFKGSFDAENSPFIYDVDASTPEIVVDLDNPPK
jgi:hypothetical protein